MNINNIKCNKNFLQKVFLYEIFLGDVRDLERLKSAMNGVDFVIHAQL